MLIFPATTTALGPVSDSGVVVVVKKKGGQARLESIVMVSKTSLAFAYSSSSLSTTRGFDAYPGMALQWFTDTKEISNAENALVSV